MVRVTGVDAASGTRRFAPSPAAAAAMDAASGRHAAKYYNFKRPLVHEPLGNKKAPRADALRAFLVRVTGVEPAAS